MNNVTTIGIDLAKQVFALHGVDETGKAVLIKPRVMRDQLAEIIAQLPPCLIGMEACTGAHHWARVFSQYGHTVKLMAPKFVAPYRMSGRHGKNDANDAMAICEAVTRPTMRFVPVKTVTQQSLLCLHPHPSGIYRRAHWASRWSFSTNHSMLQSHSRNISVICTTPHSTRTASLPVNLYVRRHEDQGNPMSTEQTPIYLSAELTLKREIRRAKLLENAKGRGLFSWLDLAFFLPVVVFGYLAFSGGEKLQRETIALIVSFTMIVQWSIMRLSIRLNSLIQYLLEQPQAQEAQLSAPLS